ncbi:MAG: BlaI/MecI/CopY family transcriptional regulator [Planctomycetes bacterium]|nr:BlaI/MecI/CopY family transcriptional regulator [Planctomycetota bacterium]
MARPKSAELTTRELEVMHVFWEDGSLTAMQARERLAHLGRDLAYTTVATLIKLLVTKGFLKQTNSQRPFFYVPIRSFEDVSSHLISDLVERVFRGSREALLVQMMESQALTARERRLVKQFLREKPS